MRSDTWKIRSKMKNKDNESLVRSERGTNKMITKKFNKQQGKRSKSNSNLLKSQTPLKLESLRKSLRVSFMKWRSYWGTILIKRCNKWHRRRIGWRKCHSKRYSLWKRRNTRRWVSLLVKIFRNSWNKSNQFYKTKTVDSYRNKNHNPTKNYNLLKRSLTNKPSKH